MKKGEDKNSSSTALTLAIVGLSLSPLGWIVASFLIIVATRLISIYGGLTVLFILFGIPAILGLILGIKQFKRTKDKSSIWAIIISVIAILSLLAILITLVIFLHRADVALGGCLTNPNQAQCQELAQAMATGGALQ